MECRASNTMITGALSEAWNAKLEYRKTQTVLPGGVSEGADAANNYNMISFGVILWLNCCITEVILFPHDNIPFRVKNVAQDA